MNGKTRLVDVAKTGLMDLLDPKAQGIAQDMAGFAQSQANNLQVLQNPTRPRPVDAGFVGGDQGRAQQVQDFVRQFGGQPQAPQQAPQPQNILRDSEGRPVTSSSGEPVRTRDFRQVIGQRAQQLMQDVDPEKAKNQDPAQVQNGAFAVAAAEGSNTLANEADQGAVQSTLKKAFGNEEMWLTLAMGFNGMRMRPDATLGAALADRLKTIRATKQQNKTSMMLLNSTNPQMKKVGELMAYGGLTYKEALAAAKQSDFDKKLALIGGDVTKWKDTYGGSGTTVTIGGEGSKGWEQIDKDFGQVWIDWNKGGADAAYKNIGSLKTVLNALEGGEQLTGTIIGLTPDVALKVFNPESVDARQRVENVVQQSMKEILGAQFTEKEGERLIARSYDPALSPAQNASRLKALVMMLEGAAAAKEQMVKHFGAKGTLAGFERTSMPTALDFEMAMDNAAPLTKERRDSLAKPQNAPQIGTVVDGYRFTGGDPSKEANWTKVGQ